jgi:hypothetical protein
MLEEKKSNEPQNPAFLVGAVISRFSLDERIYSLRHKQWGKIKSVDGNKGYVIAFSDDKYDYEYHYPNEVSQNGL